MGLNQLPPGGMKFRGLVWVPIRSPRSSPTSWSKLIRPVPESDLCENPIEIRRKAKSQIAGVGGKFTLWSFPAASDSSVERHREAIFKPRQLSAIIGMTVVDILKASYFLGCFGNLRALRTYPIDPILHTFRISRRGMKTYLRETRSVFPI